jgi:hypothetical protein
MPPVRHYDCILSKYLLSPTEQHLAAATQCAKYLISTAYWEVRLGGPSQPTLEDFTDASWADNPDTRRSTSGYLCCSSGLVSWKSGRQPLVTTSPTEAEYVAMTLSIKEGTAIRNLLRRLDMEQQVVMLYEDK